MADGFLLPGEHQLAEEFAVSRGTLREALAELYRSGPHLSDDDRHSIRYQTDRITHYVEDLDLARERALVLHGELQNKIAEQQNSRTYLLSIVATIFLPLSFLTGVFGTVSSLIFALVGFSILEGWKIVCDYPDSTQTTVEKRAELPALMSMVYEDMALYDAPSLHQILAGLMQMCIVRDGMFNAYMAARARALREGP